MHQSNKSKQLTKWLLKGIPVIILLGTLMHYIYEWSGNQPIVGLFSPVNESVWEHLKLIFYPTLLWWSLGSLLYKDNIHLPNWIFAGSVSLILGPFLITTLYYTLTGALGIHSIAADIIIFIIAVIISQLVGLILYNTLNVSDNDSFIPILSVVLMIIAFTVFTFYPPDLPIFISMI